jgi:hypothetical protein
MEGICNIVFVLHGGCVIVSFVIGRGRGRHQAKIKKATFEILCALLSGGW